MLMKPQGILKITFSSPTELGFQDCCLMKDIERVGFRAQVAPGSLLVF